MIAVASMTVALVMMGNRPPSQPNHPGQDARAGALPSAAQPKPGTLLSGTDTRISLGQGVPLRLIEYNSGGQNYLLNPVTGHFTPNDAGAIVSPDGWHEAISAGAGITFFNLRTGQRYTIGYLGNAIVPLQHSLNRAAEYYSPNSRYLMLLGGGHQTHIVIVDTETWKFWQLPVPAVRTSSSYYSESLAWWSANSEDVILQVSKTDVGVFSLHGQRKQVFHIGPNGSMVDVTRGLLLYIRPQHSRHGQRTYAYVMDMTTGKPIARIPDTSRIITGQGVFGFYGTAHVYGWDANRLVVRDFAGRITKVLAVVHGRYRQTEQPQLYFAERP